MTMTLEPQSKFLRAVADEIRKEGHAGWGNTCEQAADAIDAHLREREAAKAGVTDEIVEQFKSAFAIHSTISPAYDACIHAAIEAVAPMLASAQKPIPMILHCPSCHAQHIDAVEADGVSVWENPPHRSHLCHNCGTIWRPADVPTVGVEKIQTEGKNDVLMPTPTASARVPDVVTPVHAASGLNASERHAWALGWNDCRDAILAAAPKRGEG